MGKIEESFEFLENVLDKAKQGVAKGSEISQFEVLESLIVLARLSMEVGVFPTADLHLNEARAILTSGSETLKRLSEERYVYYWCKYYHIQGKTFWRELYQQKSSDLFKEGIDYVKGIAGFDKLQAKFLCKLYEGLAHLLCEPLMFDWAEELLNEAEGVYLGNKKHLFTDLDVVKFMLKKSSFLKK